MEYRSKWHLIIHLFLHLYRAMQLNKPTCQLMWFLFYFVESGSYGSDVKFVDFLGGWWYHFPPWRLKCWNLSKFFSNSDHDFFWNEEKDLPFSLINKKRVSRLIRGKLGENLDYKPHMGLTRTTWPAKEAKQSTADVEDRQLPFC